MYTFYQREKSPNNLGNFAKIFSNDVVLASVGAAVDVGAGAGAPGQQATLKDIVDHGSREVTGCYRVGSREERCQVVFWLRSYLVIL